MTKKAFNQIAGAMAGDLTGTVTGRLSKSDKLEMYKRMYNVTTGREPGEPKGYLIDEADDLPPFVGIDYSSVEDRIAAYWLGLEGRRIPVTTDDFIYTGAGLTGVNPKPGINLTRHTMDGKRQGAAKRVIARRKANKAARKARAKAR